MKILSPAGNFESLKMAVYNGADEVYLGINQFNARNNIDGFTMETLKDAIDFSHIHGVKVLLAINILFSDAEMQSALDTIVEAYNMGVDAFIIQDLGLISLVYNNYPQIEIHASTQMGLHNLEGVKEVVKYGVKRVVLARETPLKEIRRIKDNVDVEIEYFAHGALCVSFSGNCYMSSYFFGASGNRGKCKQLCRLPYTLYNGKKQIKKGYLLSAKDFNMIKRLPDLEKAGVEVLKIEGRARRPYYVGAVTKAYRDALIGKDTPKQELELAFNRTFTEGYFNGNGEMISEIQNHIGVLVGKVEKVNNGKNFNEVFISSNIELSPKSTFKFFNGNKENNTLTAYDLTLCKKCLYMITTTQKVNVGDSVRLIVDAQKEEKTLSLAKRRKIRVSLEMAENKNAKAILYIDNKQYIIEGEQCQSAIKQPLTQENLLENFAKSQDFEVELKFDLLEKVFMPKQKLNDFRRKVFEKTKEVFTSTGRKPLNKITFKKKLIKAQLLDYAIISENTEVPNSKTVIYSPEIYELQDILQAKEIALSNGKNFYLDTPNFALKEDIELLKNIIEQAKLNIVANNYFALSFDCKKIIGYGLNVYNSYTQMEYDTLYISAENGEELTAPLMTLRHCPIKSHVGGDCKNCKYNSEYFYKMDNGKQLTLKRKRLSDCTFYLI